MTPTDSLGRRRLPGQHRGLRPLFPKLPADFETRLLRIAMSTQAWRQLEALAADPPAATRPRAIGAAIERALAHADAPSRRVREFALPAPPATRLRHASVHSDWLAWQFEKERRLLGDPQRNAAAN